MDKSDLFAAINDVNDKLILEASEEYCKSIKKVRIYRMALFAAILVVIILGIVKIRDIVSPDSAPKHKTTELIKRWDEMQIYEKYVWLNLDGIKYTSTAGECGNEAGRLIGVYTAEGMENTQPIEHINSSGKLSDASGGFSGSEDMLVNHYIIPIQEQEEHYVKHEKMVRVYEIVGVSRDFAVAVQFDETGEYYAYCNMSYTTDSYDSFSDACQLEKYLEVNRIYLYEDGDVKYVSEGGIATRMLMDTLFSGEDLPMFLTEDFPAEFLQGKVISDGQNGKGTKPYNPNPVEVPGRVAEFCKDKEYGKRLVSISVNYNLFEDKNISIAVYSGGFVSTNIGMSGKSFFVGKDAIEDFIAVLKENLDFSIIEEEGGSSGGFYL